MNSLNFWKDWNFSLKILFFFCSFIFLIILLLYTYLFFLGDEATIAWQNVGELETIPVIIDQFTRYFFDFNIQVDNYLLVETFQAGNLVAHPLSHYLHFAFLLLGMILFLTVISDLNRIAYLIGVTLLFFLWANMNLELIGIFHNLPWIKDKLFLVFVIIAYIPISYLFHIAKKKVAHIWRFFIYTLITIILIGIASHYGKGALPIHHLTHYTLAVPLVITIFFCAINAHEIIRIFIYIITAFNNRASTGSLRHLFILCLVYLFNLIYVYLRFTENIDWGILYLHPFILYIITTLLGLWGWKQRKEQFSNYFNYSPTGVLLYISLAIISFSNISFALATNNTSLIEVYEDSLLYIHFAFGFVFLAYVLTNYGKLLGNNERVYKVLYKQERTSFFISWFMGIPIIILLLFKANFITYHQAFSGYYNSLGYLNNLLKDRYAAKQYYRISLGYDPLNFHANYVLGTMAKEANEEVVALIFFEDANIKNFRPQTYSQIAEVYLKDKKFFKSLFTLREGIKNCPESGELYNNLALLFTQTEISDSVDYYLKLALTYSHHPEIIQSNRFLLATKYDLLNKLEDIYLKNPQEYIGIYTNEAAFLTKEQKTPVRSFNKKLLSDSILSTPELCYLYNYSLNSKHAEEDIISLLEYYENFEGNYDFNIYLKTARANLLFQQGNFLEAFKLFKYLYKSSVLTNSYYANLIGMRFFQIGEYKQAAKYLEIAFQRGMPEARISMAVALSHLKDKQQAIKAWKSIVANSNNEDKAIAEEMIYLMNISPKKQLILSGSHISDKTKYLFLEFQGIKLSDNDFDKIWATITDKKMQNLLLSNRIDYFLQKTDISKSTKYFNILKNRNGDIEVELAYLKYLHATDKMDNSFFRKITEIQYPKTRQGLKAYYLASYYSAQRSAKKAEEYYKKAIVSLPFKVDLWIDFAEMYRRVGEKEKVYKILLNGYEINPNSAEILKHYILECLKMNYDNFALLAMQDLENLITNTEYQNFEKIYQIEFEKAKKIFQEEW